MGGASGYSTSNEMGVAPASEQGRASEDRKLDVAESAQGAGLEVEPITPVDTTFPSAHLTGGEAGMRRTPEERDVSEGEEEEEEEVEEEEEEEEGELEEDEEESPSQNGDIRRTGGFPRVSCSCLALCASYFIYFILGLQGRLTLLR